MQKQGGNNLEGDRSRFSEMLLPAFLHSGCICYQQFKGALSPNKCVWLQIARMEID